MRCRKVCEQAASGGRHASERPADPQSGIQSGSCRRPAALRGENIPRRGAPLLYGGIPVAGPSVCSRFQDGGRSAARCYVLRDGPVRESSSPTAGFVHVAALRVIGRSNMLCDGNY